MGRSGTNKGHWSATPEPGRTLVLGKTLNSTPTDRKHRSSARETGPCPHRKNYVHYNDLPRPIKPNDARKWPADTFCPLAAEDSGQRIGPCGLGLPRWCGIPNLHLRPLHSLGYIPVQFLGGICPRRRSVGVCICSSCLSRGAARTTRDKRRANEYPSPRRPRPVLDFSAWMSRRYVGVAPKVAPGAGGNPLQATPNQAGVNALEDASLRSWRARR
jgi:hypothetical protein